MRSHRHYVTTSINQKKLELRQKLKLVVRSIPKLERARKSALILEKLRSSTIFKNAKSILLFASTEWEPDLWPIINNFQDYDKTFYLPAVSELRIGKLTTKQKLVKTKLGIFEPTILIPAEKIERIDLILLPALAFDMRGNRLGHGSGWYDKFMAMVDYKACIGLAFKEQIIKKVPTKELDIKADKIFLDKILRH